MRKIHYFLILLSQSFFAQVIIDAKTNTLEVNLNERFFLEILLEIDSKDNKMESLIKLPDLSKFNIIDSSSEQNEIQIKGQEKLQIICQYVLEAKQKGILKIGSALVKVNGKMYKSEPFDILVKEKILAKSNELKNKKNFVKLELDIENPVYFPFQNTRVLVIAKSNNINAFNNIEAFEEENSKLKNKCTFTKVNSEIKQYQTSDALVYKKTLASIECFVSDKNEKLEGYKFIYKSNNQKDNQILSTACLNFNPKILPKSKVSFNNAVGEFEVKLIKKNSEIMPINEPIEFSIEISGSATSETIFPKHIKSKDYIVYPLKKELTAIDSTDTRKFIQNYLVYPKKHGKIQVKFEDFTYFDTKKNTYLSKNIPNLDFEVEENSVFVGQSNEIKQILRQTSVEMSPNSSKIKNNSKKSLQYWLRFYVAGLLIIFLLGYITYRAVKKLLASKFKSKNTNQTIVCQDYKNHINSLLKDLDSDLANENYTKFIKSINQIIKYSESYFVCKNTSLKKYLANNTSTELIQNYEEQLTLIELITKSPFVEKDLCEKLKQKTIEFHQNLA